MRARRVHIRGAALALLSAAAVPATAAAQPAQQPVAVEFVEVRQQPLVLDLRLVGTIAASDSIDLSFPAGGRITEITVRAGDRVQAGDPLARTDGVQQQQALNQALAAVAAAEATLQQADQAAIRAAEMLRRGVGTRAESDMANQALSAAQGQLAAARTGADQAQRAVEDTVIHAPQAAVVTARMAEPGQVVGAAQPILTLAALTGFEAVFNVPDSPHLDQAHGALVSLVPLDRPETRLSATVTEIAPLVDPATAAVTVRAEINPRLIDSVLEAGLLGAAVEGVVHLKAGTGIEIPWTALTATGDGPAVWRIDEEGVVAITPVEIERFANGRVVLKSGVAPGDSVVGEGSQLMFPGRQVRPGKGR